ncbi:MAG: hypothetical protein ACPGVT_06060 [Maricaulaceae bacterium]
MHNPKAKSGPAIGVDIGGVIIKPARASGDTSFFSSGYLDTPSVEGAIEGVAHLNKTVFPGQVFLVSKAKSGTAQKTREWLHHQNFYERTGLTEDKLFFCEKREGKVPIAKRLGLTTFIDDRVDVLGHLSHIQARYLFAESDEWLPDTVPAELTPVIGWQEFLSLLEAKA